jgi:4-amino-4-deoxy-L-arabinose transferase-like glycosyltransferase
MKILERMYSPLITASVVIRSAILVIPGNSVRTPWSGGGDMDAYVLLARNLVMGQGYTYAHVPSAWRTPGYPLVIAVLMRISGQYFPITVRLFQLLASFAAAYFCMRAARILFDDRAGKVALLAALYFPTLLYFSGEFLSESLSALLVALFLWLLAEDIIRPSWISAAAMGLTVGLGTLFRPNVAALGLVAVAGSWLARPTGRRRPEIALIPLCAFLVISPWLIRNYEVFGRFLFTTKSGADALAGILNPESRTLPGWEDRMRGLVGHLLPNDVETNSLSRISLGPEIELDRRCWQATRMLWREMKWGALVRLTLMKWEAYWLSTDQLLEPGEISRTNRVFHATAVVVFWGLLVLAGIGLWNLKKTRPKFAAILFGYMILMTVLHTPFVMNSRIRAPLLDPLLAVLVGGYVSVASRIAIVISVRPSNCSSIARIAGGKNP